MTVLLFLTPKIHTSYFLAGPTDSSNLYTTVTKSPCPQIPPPPNTHPISLRSPTPRIQTALHPGNCKGGDVRAWDQHPVSRAPGMPKSTAASSWCCDRGDPLESQAQKLMDMGQCVLVTKDEERLKGAFSKPIGAWLIRCPRATNKY